MKFPEYPEEELARHFAKPKTPEELHDKICEFRDIRWLHKQPDQAADLPRTIHFSRMGKLARQAAIRIRDEYKSRGIHLPLIPPDVPWPSLLDDMERWCVDADKIIWERDQQSAQGHPGGTPGSQQLIIAEVEPLRETIDRLRAFAKGNWIDKELSQQECDTSYHELIACFHPSFEYSLRWLGQRGHADSAGNLKKRQRDLYEKVRVQYLPSEPNLRVLFPHNLPVEILSLAEEIEKTVARATTPEVEGLGKCSQLKAHAKKSSNRDKIPRGRPRKHSDAKCKKAWKQFDDIYAESNDSTGAWNTVADNLDFPNGEAARKACERYRQSQNSGQNGHN